MIASTFSKFIIELNIFPSEAKNCTWHKILLCAQALHWCLYSHCSLDRQKKKQTMQSRTNHDAWIAYQQISAEVWILLINARWFIAGVKELGKYPFPRVYIYLYKPLLLIVWMKEIDNVLSMGTATSLLMLNNYVIILTCQ